jgi:hypothetical protein
MAKLPSALASLVAAALALPLLVGGGGCEKSAPSAEAGPNHVTWDLSHDQRVDRVAWPADVTGNTWLISGPMVVDLTLPDGRRTRYTVDDAQLRREGDRVVKIVLLFPSETLDGTYARARALCAEWGIADLEALDAWYAARQRDAGNATDPTRPNLARVWNDVAGVIVRPSYDAARRAPWFASVGFGFPSPAGGMQDVDRGG